jgi:hypothetical protein
MFNGENKAQICADLLILIFLTIVFLVRDGMDFGEKYVST